MTDAATQAPETPVKKSKTPLILGLLLALAGAAGGYFGISSGMFPLGESHASEDRHPTPEALGDIGYVPIDPVIISLTDAGRITHLRFRGQMEVENRFRADVELVLPRVVDVLNSYLRALEISDLRDPQALTRLRSQILRRIQIVVGPERVRDLLIMEFVLS